MIQISGAVLTSSINEFVRQVQALKVAGVVSVDVDITESAFAGSDSLTFDQVHDKVRQNIDLDWGWHLMIQEPQQMVQRMIEGSIAGYYYPWRIYVHQEANIEFLAQENCTQKNIGIAVKADSELKPIWFYQKFPEVQLMTVVPGAQGNPFLPEVLNRIKWLRIQGYQGRISLDGGINQQTAPLVKAASPTRVSVGSYFSQSANLALDVQALKLALNS